MKAGLLAIFIIGGGALVQQVSGQINAEWPGPQKVMTAKERTAIGYEKMSASQKDALDAFAIRYAGVAADARYASDMKYFAANMKYFEDLLNSAIKKTNDKQ